MTRDTVVQLAMQLSESERARLASEMLHSLPRLLTEPDGGLLEAKRRDRELDDEPGIAISLEELDARVAGRSDV